MCLAAAFSASSRPAPRHPHTQWGSGQCHLGLGVAERSWHGQSRLLRWGVHQDLGASSCAQGWPPSGFWSKALP